MMTIADMLKAELGAAAADLERGCDRAADAATVYIVRRLQQLERRFPRHRFVYLHRQHLDGLHVYPAVAGYNCVCTLLTRLCGRSTRWKTMLSLGRVDRDLNELGRRVACDFDRLMGRIDVSGRTTDRLAVSAGVMAMREYDEAISRSDRADVVKFNRRTIHRRR